MTTRNWLQRKLNPKNVQKPPRDPKYAVKVLMFRIVVFSLFLVAIATIGFRRPTFDELMMMIDSLVKRLLHLFG